MDSHNERQENCVQTVLELFLKILKFLELI